MMDWGWNLQQIYPEDVWLSDHPEGVSAACWCRLGADWLLYHYLTCSMSPGEYESWRRSTFGLSDNVFLGMRLTTGKQIPGHGFQSSHTHYRVRIMLSLHARHDRCVMFIAHYLEQHIFALLNNVIFYTCIIAPHYLLSALHNVIIYAWMDS